MIISSQNIMKENLEHVLQNTFGLESFREGQEEIITSIVE